MLKTIGRRIAGIIERVTTLLGVLAAIIVFIMMLIITYDVFMRYVLSSPSLWVDEISAYMVVAITFLGLGYTALMKGHIRMDLVVERLSSRTQRVLEITMLLVAMIFFVALLWGGWNLTADGIVRNRMSPGYFSIPLAPVYAMVPVGIFFLSLAVLLQIVRAVRKARP